MLIVFLILDEQDANNAHEYYNSDAGEDSAYFLAILVVMPFPSPLALRALIFSAGLFDT